MHPENGILVQLEGPTKWGLGWLSARWGRGSPQLNAANLEGWHRAHPSAPDLIAHGQTKIHTIANGKAQPPKPNAGIAGQINYY